jgi:hypothetical protein
MPTQFQEFLRQKVEVSDWKERKQRRAEWLSALNRLFDQIRERLQQADPDGVLELVPYEVQCVEERLGLYDAPALEIRLNTDSVDIRPVGRHEVGPLSLRHLQGIQSNEQRWGDLSGGRVDITNGERRHILLRSIVDGQDLWYAIAPDRIGPILFDANCLEAILQDLLK